MISKLYSDREGERSAGVVHNNRVNITLLGSKCAGSDRQHCAGLKKKKKRGSPNLSTARSLRFSLGHQLCIFFSTMCVSGKEFSFISGPVQERERQIERENERAVMILEFWTCHPSVVPFRPVCSVVRLLACVLCVQ